MRRLISLGLLASLALAAIATVPATAQQQRRPNILVIMGDDIGIWNIGAYHRGMMSGKTPNLDKLATEGMIFTDYYAEASCTAGRANFITGELPIRTGLTTVGQAGADVGMPAQAATLATALKTQGYATGQFGKNHLGDLNKFLPTLHGFDEFFGYLYHLDAMSDPYWYSFPVNQDYYNKYGPRSLVKVRHDHLRRSVGEIVQRLHGQGQAGREAVLRLAQHHAHARVDVPVEEVQCDAEQRHDYGLEEAGMAQLDDSVGALLKHLDDIGEANNTIVIFTTDNGAEVFTWPDGGMTPFKNTKGTVGEGGFRVPAIIRWPGQIKPGTVENGLISGLDWFPTLMAAAGNPNIKDQLLKGVKLGERTYKNHLDGYNQMDLLTGKGPSKRHEIFYFGGAQLGALRVDNFKFTFYAQPFGWPGEKTTTDMPGMVNIRQDPFERTPMIRGESSNTGAFGYGNDFFAREFWRFVQVQEFVGQLAQTAIEYPPMQDPASFNLEAVKKKVEEMIKNRPGQ
jgi:arylsulfatase